MSIVVDYTGPISVSALQSAGVSGVCRYLSPLTSPAASYKVIRRQEYQDLTDAGIKVTLNWEFAALDWLVGKLVGADHAKAAVSQARWLGYPQGHEIIGSADFDMNRTQWTGACKGYAQAFASVIKDAGYRPGVYGPYDVLQWVRDDGLMDVFWQSMSTGHSQGRNANQFADTQLWQKGPMTIGGVSVDYNHIIVPDWGRKMDETGRTSHNADLYGWALYTGQDRIGVIGNEGQPLVEINTFKSELYSKLDSLAANVSAIKPAQVDVTALAAALAPLLAMHSVTEIEDALRAVLHNA